MRAFGNGVHRAPEDPARKRKPVGEHHDGSFGVYMSHKIQKLRGQNAQLVGADETARAPLEDARDETAALFDGVHVFVDGYTVPSKEEIRTLLLLHGGGFEHYETSRVTHVVATHLATSKLLQYKRMRHPPPVVSPEWIVKSIEAKRLLPVQPFLYQAFADPTQSSVLSGIALSEPTSKSQAQPTVPEEVALNREDEAVDDNSFSESEGGSDEEGHAALADQYAALSQRQNGTAAHEEEDADQPPSEGGDMHTNSTRDGPSFVRHFFAKSRLHHIGSWRTTFQLRAPEFLSKYKGKRFRQEPVTSSDRVILHVDMDCFFVSVAVRDKPEYRNLPVAIAHSGNAGSSEISSCNYLAREKGLRAGMFMQSAKQLCPELVVLPYHFEEIEACSFQIYDIFFSRTPYVQAMSCDEAYLEFGKNTDGVAMAKEIREAIYEATRCTASVGVSYNILLAKLATRQAKPDGLFSISSPQEAEPFLQSLKISDLPGVGYRMSAKMEELGLVEIQQLRALSKAEMSQHFGKTTSEMLFNYARGIDQRPLSVESNLMRKSVSAVVNFGIRFQTWKDATEFMMALAEELSSRLQSLKVRAKCLTLLIKKRREGAPVVPSKFMGHGICDSFSRSQLLAEPTDSDILIGRTGIELLRQFHFPVEELRGVGIQATKLVSLLKPVDSRAGERFRAWLADSESGHGKAKLQETSQPRSDLYAESFSQINMAVLDELPPDIREEVIATYQHQQRPRVPKAPLLKTSANQPLLGKGKQRMGRTKTIAAPGCSSAPVTGSLNEIRMSQVDDDVYQALPLAIRREIDAVAKKSKGSKTIKPKTTHQQETHPPLRQNTLELKTIEDLFCGVAAVVTDVGDGAFDEATIRSAFDAILSRILVEIEMRALDNGLRMLRFVRRKCQQLTTAISTPLVHLVTSGFNLVLEQVNRELEQQYRGSSFSSRLVAPL